MNTKSTLVFLVILGLFLAALISRNPALAWMALPFLFYLVAGLLTAPGEVHLKASRRISHEPCEAGTLITMTLTVENRGSTIARLRIIDPVPQKMQVMDGFIEQVSTLPAGEKTVLCYRFKAPRGMYHWRMATVTVSDPFALFEKTVELSAEAQILMLPAQTASNRVRLHPPHTLHAAGPNLSRLAGPGIDFFGVREYHPGDSLRWVHWRLSARHPRQFYTKEFEREEMADIGIILDGSITNNLNDGKEDLLEYSIQAAAALSKSLLQMGNRLSLLALGDRITRVFPGTGKRQLARILNQLAVCEPGERVSLDTLKYLPVRLFPSHSFIIVISPICRLDFTPIARLRANGYQVMLISPDPVQFASRAANSQLAVRAAQLERAALLWRIREMGVQVVNWPVEKSLLDLVHVDRWVRI